MHHCNNVLVIVMSARLHLQYSIKTLAIAIMHTKVNNCSSAKKVVDCSSANKIYQLY